MDETNLGRRGLGVVSDLGKVGTTATHGVYRKQVAALIAAGLPSATFSEGVTVAGRPDRAGLPRYAATTFPATGLPRCAGNVISYAGIATIAATNERDDYPGGGSAAD